MAKGEAGALGNFIGPISNITGYQRRGQQLMRKKRKKVTSPPSPKQLRQRMIFSLARVFCKKITTFLQLGYHLEEIGTIKTANNLAISSVMTNAIQGDYPDLSVDCSKVIVTSGPLPISNDLKMEKTDGGLLFSWKYEFQIGGARDQIMLVVYPHNSFPALYLLSGARRSDGQHFLEVPSFYKGSVADTWVSFISDGRDSIATSVHTGIVVL